MIWVELLRCTTVLFATPFVRTMARLEQPSMRQFRPGFVWAWDSLFMQAIMLKQLWHMRYKRCAAHFLLRVLCGVVLKRVALGFLGLRGFVRPLTGQFL